MASVTINGIFFTYPDDPCPVFNPAIVSVGHQVARVRVTVNGKAVTYQAYGGDCTIDISSMLQVEFDNLQLGGALQPGMNELGKSVATSIEALDHDGTVLAQLNASIFCVWAALAPGEMYENPYRHTMHLYYDYMVGLYFIDAEDIDEYIVNPIGGRTLVNTHEVDAQGVWYFAASPTAAGQRVIFTKHNAPSVVYAEVTVKEYREGIYLRWIDRHGFWRWWLFKAGDPQRNVASAYGAFDRIDIEKYNAYGHAWVGTSGRRQNLTRNDIIPLCAPLVDQSTFDMLQDLTTSPCVEMVIGQNEQSNDIWSPVTIQPGQYTKDVKKPEQDFVCNLVLPEIPIQQL